MCVTPCSACATGGGGEAPALWFICITLIILHPSPCAPYASTHHPPGYNSLAQVVSEWDEGVTVDTKEGQRRIAPLRILEHPEMLVHKKGSQGPVWRNGAAMRKYISSIKVLVYAVHRRVSGGPKTKEEADATLSGAVHRPRQALSAAIGSLEALMNGTDPHNKPTVSKLEQILRASEISPAQYEAWAAATGADLSAPLSSL